MRKYLTILLLFPLLCKAQFTMPSKVGFNKSASGITFVGQIGKASLDGSNVTTTGLNTTGSTLIVAVISSFLSVASRGISDSKGNTWSLLTEKTNTNAAVRVRIYYCYAPTTDAAQTFSTTGAGTSYPNIEVMAFKGTSGTFDAQNGTTGGVSPISTGTVTPASNGEVIIAGLGTNQTLFLDAITSGFTHYDNAAIHAGSFFVSGAYLIQQTAASQGCTFTWTGLSNDEGAAVIAAFK